MTILSKVATLGHVFGVDDGKLDTQARAITLLFPDLVLIATYNPQGGFTDETLAFKTTWEKRLGEFLQEMRRKARVTGLKMIWVGDLNVNPNKEDCSPGVWDHLQGKLKGRIPGGCRMIDVKTYRQNVAAIDGVNLAEYFHPGTEIPKTHYCNDISRKHVLDNVLTISLCRRPC